jgi:hypothetical protein
MEYLGPERKKRRVWHEPLGASQQTTYALGAGDEQQQESSPTIHKPRLQDQDAALHKYGQFPQQSSSHADDTSIISGNNGTTDDATLDIPLNDQNSPYQVAKWCQILKDGNCWWDNSKIKCFMSQDELSDELLMRNLVQGTVMSSKMHPLIFEKSSRTDNKMVQLRSLSFFNELLTESEDKVARKYLSLSIDEKRVVALGVRDLFLAEWIGILNNDEKHILCGMTEILDDSVRNIQVMGMGISFHPSTNFKAVRLIEALDDIIGEDYASLFAQVLDFPKLFAVFVNPTELSFHNFENIVPLDRWFESKIRNGQHELDDGLSLSFFDVRQLQDNREVFTCKLQGASSLLVKQVPSLDLYVAPLNKETRGGERFIFHSALLSKALNGAVRSSGMLGMLAKGHLASTFEFVNYIFRCNKFRAEDAKFTKHLDTPYYDSTQSHVSKYTLIIYLTSGHGEPALRVCDVNIDNVEDMTCIIFDQSYEHEGNPFIEDDKIFIRTELVFTDRTLHHNSQIASLFGQACYMSGEGIFDQNLASYAHECFERANSLHWAIEQNGALTSLYLHKHFGHIHFVTNGYDYWFTKDGNMNSIDCGVVAVMDYLNCKIENQPFRALCGTTTISDQFRSTEGVWAFLLGVEKEKSEPFKRLEHSDMDNLFKKQPSKPFVKRPPWYDSEPDEEEEDEGEQQCCPFHYYRTFDAWKNVEVRESYETCCQYTRDKILGVPILLFGQKVVINESNIKIFGDKMYFLKGSNESPIPPINFAACWNDVSTLEFIDIDQEIGAPQLLIPPIIFHEFDQGYHFVLDLFRNDWMLEVNDGHKIPVPIISNDLPVTKKPFMKRLRRYSLDLDGLSEISDFDMSLSEESGDGM